MEHEEEEVRSLPKNVFLIASFVLYYVCCYLVMWYNKAEYRPTRWFSAAMLAGMVVFVLLMLLFHSYPTISIAVTVLYIWLVFAGMRLLYNRMKVIKTLDAERFNEDEG